MDNTLALVVDDSKVARLTLGKLLRAQGIDVVEEASAEGALAWLESAQTLPDLIFMDVMMGGMDGLTATRTLKAQPTLANIPVVICTGKETEADKAAALATGAQAVLAKPPQAEALDAVLGGLKSAEPEVESPPESRAQSDAIDMEALFDTLRQRWMPEWEQKLTSLKAELHQTVKESLSQIPQPPAADVLIASVSEQLGSTVSQQVSAFQQGFSSDIEQKVGPLAKQAVEQALALSGLEDKIKQLVISHNTAWLAEQQTAQGADWETTLNDKLRHFADTVLAEQLESALAERELSESIMTQTQHQIIAALQAEVRVLKGISIVAGLLALTAIGLSFF
jgi:CheY-like chemotaxis protein